MCPSEMWCRASVNVVSQCHLQAVLRSVWSVAKLIGEGWVCAAAAAAAAALVATVSHDTDMGGHPLKADVVSQRGEWRMR